YGKQIVQSLSAHLTEDYGRGWKKRNIDNMIRFSEVIPDIRIVQSLIAQLTWTHIQQLIYIDDPLRRDFYIEMCKHENWSTRMLKKKIEYAILHRWKHF
ncbi:MAG: DUF1016 N-terminal domain-containing protein, partial [Phycisphaerales bacterium]|nr:DUF1016 N-terminal domain-containing protein [Phycisphaerales bacterium]